ncbi:hypothetical protein HID58_075295 [Brassica napus]|uniref:Sinapine esterase n=1 Tax=Brassica napus TaxID=3708 RepID=A0ABQ7YLX1_BRANA|nr:hypothetical protein HID58_075295 [Brassica napus]
MASSLKKLITSILLFFFYTIIVASSEPSCRLYKSIISFGDSIADTGNYLHLFDVNHPPQAAFLPYGETFFSVPTGRNSDGRLIIDFIAEFLGLPYVPPYFGSQNVSFEQGVNFAVYGATALDRAFLIEKGIVSDFTNVSLSVQLNTFKQILPTLCASSSHDCRKVLEDSLILMGELGGNDYNYPFFEDKSINEIKELTPLIIKAISDAIVDLIDLGGKTFLVPGSFPVGCSAAYLTLFQTAKEKDYDPLTGCLPWLNDFGKHHDEQLKTEIRRLRKLYPHVNIIYADYYNSLYRLYQKPTKYGFKNRPLAACCGVGGQYNFTIGEECGYEGVGYCQNPSEYINWDGYHLTEAAHQKMAHGILNGPYATPAFNWSCLDAASVDNESSFDDSDSSLSMAFPLKKLISSFLPIFSPTTIVNLSEPPCVRYKSIISFGDSSADTGNFLSLSDDINHPPQAAFLPYGETFFHPPSGRYFDCRLIIDFIGVNFAVYGATALDRALLVEKGIKSDFTNRGVRRLADTHGRVGVNDYNYPFFEGESINEIKELVPLVIKAISSAIVELIDLGGKTFLVPGNFPLGCFPAYLTLFETSEKEHDPFTGFKNRRLAACCGVGGQYNFTIDEECGSKGVSYCQNPSEYVNWMQLNIPKELVTVKIHPHTRKMAHGLLNGPYITPVFDWSCLSCGSADKEYCYSS